MREIFKLSIVLVIITVVSGSLLGVTNNVTKDIIEEKAMEANIEYMKEIFPDADTFSVVEDIDFDLAEEAYVAYESDEIIGYVIKTVKSGYGGDIVQLTGIYIDDVIAGIRIASHNETPSLGEKIVEVDFRDQFVNKSAKAELKLDGDDDDSIDGITGATTSSKAVIDAVNSAIKLYESLFK